MSGIVGLTPLMGITAGSTEPYEVDFVITAYYSPLPNQCCYVKGGYTADRILNGNGIAGADGTKVYPGMIAAPGSYAFGTRVNLPGLGTFTVHDRGGAIIEQENAHRLDIWVGHGEEGLARALAFGVQRVRGTVYPVGSNQPAESVALDTFTAPVERLLPYFVEAGNFLSLRPKAGESGYSSWLLQEKLKRLGYFAHAITGKFGQVTQESFAAFLRDMDLDESSVSLTERSAAYINAALKRLAARQPLEELVEDGSSVAGIQEAQRLLRFLGYYRGRTDGKYSSVKDAIFAFQKDHGLVGTWTDAGAGRVGPITRSAIRKEWNKRIVAAHARTLLDLHRIEIAMTESGREIDRFMEEGSNGTQVKLLQQLLAERGFFPAEEVNGNYGSLTKDAVINFQLSRGIIKTRSEKGAGGIGPVTMQALKQEEKMELYRLVRAEGWRML